MHLYQRPLLGFTRLHVPKIIHEYAYLVSSKSIKSDLQLQHKRIQKI